MPTGTLPKSAKELWEKVYNASKAAGDSEERAAKKAWGAVKNAGWHKVGDKWVKKSDIVREFSMSFTSAPFDNLTGEMRWKAVASDTDKDTYQEAMSLELYRSFIKNIEQNTPPPEPFGSLVTSDYWKGGMPYLSISHFPDLNGEGVPGKVESVYVDGKLLKSKGIFHDTPLGRACWKALKKDMAENAPEDKRIRVSIAFLDLAHRHGEGQLFERKSLDDLCQECFDNVENKIYLDGYLVHEAMTRVPVNPRAEMEVEKSMSKTREEDAASIVGEEEAKKLAEKSTLIGRSDVLVEKAEDEEEVSTDVVEETPKVEEVQVDTVSKPEETAEAEVESEVPMDEEEENVPETDNPNPPEEDGSPIEEELKALSDAVLKVRSVTNLTENEKLQAVKPAIDSLGAAIERAIKSPTSEAEKPKEETVTMEIVRSLQESQQGILDALAQVQLRLEQVTKPQVTTTTPKPRSIDPNLIRSIIQKSAGETKPNSTIEICRKSVGL